MANRRNYSRLSVDDKTVEITLICRLTVKNYLNLSVDGRNYYCLLPDYYYCLSVDGKNYFYFSVDSKHG